MKAYTATLQEFQETLLTDLCTYDGKIGVMINYYTAGWKPKRKLIRATPIWRGTNITIKYKKQIIVVEGRTLIWTDNGREHKVTTLVGLTPND